jgi:hypothetical protein
MTQEALGDSPPSTDQPLSSSTSKQPWTRYPISTYQWVTLSSIPLLIGSWIGYRLELSRVSVSEAIVMDAKVGTSPKPLPITLRPVNGPLLAFKALGIGTMLSIAGVGLLTSGRMYMLLF